jgi:hypothetical protein
MKSMGEPGSGEEESGKRLINPIYQTMGLMFILASLARSFTATSLQSLQAAGPLPVRER